MRLPGRRTLRFAEKLSFWPHNSAFGEEGGAELSVRMARWFGAGGAARCARPALRPRPRYGRARATPAPALRPRYARAQPALRPPFATALRPRPRYGRAANFSSSTVSPESTRVSPSSMRVSAEAYSNGWPGSFTPITLMPYLRR